MPLILMTLRYTVSAKPFSLSLSLHLINQTEEEVHLLEIAVDSYLVNQAQLLMGTILPYFYLWHHEVYIC